MQLKRVFVRPGDISKHLKCSLCMEVFVNPHRALCGHTYCKDCIKQWLKQKILTCPQCRKEIILKTEKDLIAHNLIQDEFVFCINGPLCDWSGALQNLEAHSKKCGLKNKKIQNYLLTDDFDKGSEYIDDDLLQRIQSNCPRGTLFQRVYAKNEESRQVMDNLFQQKTETKQASEDEMDFGFIDSLFTYMEPSTLEKKSNLFKDEEQQKVEVPCNYAQSEESPQIKREIDHSNLTEMIDAQMHQSEAQDQNQPDEQEAPLQNAPLQQQVKQAKYNRRRKPVQVKQSTTMGVN